MPDSVENLLHQAFLARQDRRFDDARQALTAAVALCRHTHALPELALALTRLGAIERDTGDFHLALLHYREAVSLYRETNDALSLAHSIRHVGDIHFDSGRPDLAEPCHLEALALYRAHAHPPPLDLANAIRSLAVLKSNAGDSAQARPLWIEARGLYASLDIAAGVAEATRRLDTNLQ